MDLLDLTPDELLTTTRSVRRRLDLGRPVPLGLVEDCLRVALQAPSGSNHQGWHFVVVTDAERRAALGNLYQRAMEAGAPVPYSTSLADDPAEAATQRRVLRSALLLAERIGRCPALVLPCVEGRFEAASPFVTATMFGSILPATWSFCLAARARGLGTAWTTLHLVHEREAAEILGIPYDLVTQVAMLPVAWTQGTDFKPGPRRPLDGVLHVDGW